MDLYLVRHAQSANNANIPEGRVPDAPLTRSGERQGAFLAHWAKSAGITRLLTSPMLRCLHTVQFISKSTGLVPEVWVDLHEQGGCISGISATTYKGQPGMTAAEILERFPGYRVPPEIDDQGWWKSQPYETPEETEVRADEMAQHFKDEFGNTNETVLCVTHAAFMQFLIGEFIGHPQLVFNWVGTVYNTSVSHVQITGDEISVVTLNGVGHLPETMLTK
ncbi:MAG: histidine phosphatase family protein [Planctomycetota bacterium]|nr:histidine phosphatase family protein [Planctomycetota bacterium]MDA1141634.1 histidine phosphatase family protein [Planctomycetota bacterium]